MTASPPTASCSSRPSLPALLLIAFGAACLIVYGAAAAGRFDAPRAAPIVALVLCAAVAVAVARPLWSAYAVFLAIPLFGNHPGGRFMELINVLLAASLVGLTIAAWRQRAPLPGGTLWLAVTGYVASAALALVPTIAGLFPRWVELDDVFAMVTQAAIAPESDPLYSPQSFILLALAVGWALALVWAAPPPVFARHAFRVLVAGLLVVVTLGILDLHGLIDIERAWLHPIDSRTLNQGGLQSIFWNPGWFSWYFTMTFGVALGLVAIERSTLRWPLVSGLVVAYAYFFANRQRGGLIALHVVLLVGLVAAVNRRGSRRALAVAALVTVALLGLAGYAALHLPDPWFWAVKRLTDWNPDDVRAHLAYAAVKMWRSAPAFGIGEGAFAWRYRDYIPFGSTWDTETWGDAHSTWLQILATRGLVGLAAYLALLAAFIHVIVRAARARDRQCRGVGLGIGLAIVAFVTYSFVQYMFYLQAIQALFWGLLALAVVSAPDRSSSLARGWWRGALAAMALALGVQVWSQWPALAAATARAERAPRGFYGIEPWDGRPEPFRWSSGRGTLCLYPSAPVVDLVLVVAHPDARGRPVTVTLRTTRGPVETFEVREPALIRRSFYLVEVDAPRVAPDGLAFGECDARARPVLLTVEPSRSWSPLVAGASDPDPRRLGVGVFAPRYGDAARLTEAGFYEREVVEGREIRWTAARASRAVRLPVARATITLSVRAGNPDVRKRPVTVTLYWNTHVVARHTLSNHTWQDVAFQVTDDTREGVLTVQVDRVWQPRAAGIGDDVRYLGVQTAPLRVDAAAGYPTRTLAAGTRSRQ